jgi:hypothetical protein
MYEQQEIPQIHTWVCSGRNELALIDELDQDSDHKRITLKRKGAMASFAIIE